MSGSVLSHPVSLSEVHGTTDVAITADAEQRAAIAAEYDLLDVKALSATVSVNAEAGGGFEVSGRVVADIVQACVVSLVPVPQHIDETFTVRFVRPNSPELVADPKPHEEVVVDPDAPDPPEVLTGGSLDVGPIAEEAFVLAIDLYPRAPGATLAPPPDDGATPDSPFAILAGLKGGKG